MNAKVVSLSTVIFSTGSITKRNRIWFLEQGLCRQQASFQVTGGGVGAPPTHQGKTLCTPSYRELRANRVFSDAKEQRAPVSPVCRAEYGLIRGSRSVLPRRMRHFVRWLRPRGYSPRCETSPFSGA